MRIALLQCNPVVGDVVGNIRRIREAIETAAKQGADLCVTPELAVCGYPPRDLLLRESFAEACWAAMEDLARDLAAAAAPMPAVLIGAPVRNLEPVGNSVFNSAVLLDGGTATVVAHKTLLPSYDVFDERRYFEPGKGCGRVVVAGKRLGVTICEDVWNDKSFWTDHRYYDTDPVAELLDGSVDLLVNLSASPFSLGKQAIREKMLSSLAARHGVPLVYVNQVGGNDDLIFAGKSIAFDATGELVARGLGFVEDVVIVDPFEGIGTVQSEDPAPEAQAWNALVLGTRDYARKCGFSSVVLGLSGGIDSALVAALAAEALGPENVLGVLMPSPYSSKGSVDDSLELGRNLGIRTEIIPIEPMMQAFGTALEPVFAGRPPDVTEENIQSRIRGNLLMGISNKLGAMLLTTGNKSELSVGYCTIYGDMAGGLAVISDVPKTLVWSISRWLNAAKGREVIPVAIIDKVPSAELRPDQKDTDSLPEYEVLDAILKAYVEEKHSRAALLAMGFAEADVDRVLHLVRISEFKRRQAPPGLKITDRAFGTGWRMPVACRVNLPEGLM
ncbi:NAD+ synthase [Desulfovibrio mangrovi]|uniref:NAD+ synthase n=1 Tax=Desulfovibrio mangrovi TaxID=2976983 RepID=UPI0022462C7F|nr:NAD+ synthase [Desulfovibrio mangrovi]UZP68454.1 NAD+ synthase [Desulfovibrio mangrovi]